MARIVCNSCYDENGTVFVTDGAMIMDKGNLTFLGDASKAPRVPFEQAEISMETDGECGWCGHHAPIREFVEPRPTVASHDKGKGPRCT